MNIPLLITGLGSGIAGVFMLRMAKRDLDNKKKTTDLHPIPIGEIQPGLCLTSGEVICENPVETPYSGTPAVWYRYEAMEKHQRKLDEHHSSPDQMLSSGNGNCPFLLKDNTGVVAVEPRGGEALAYPHQRLMKSRSGKRTSIRKRIEKLKDMDRRNYPEDGKKPFFRKIDSEDAPLDIPDDLVELIPGSPEAKNTLRYYTEKWIQPGDHIFLLGIVDQDKNGKSLQIAKKKKADLLFASQNMQKLTAGAFGRNFTVGLIAGLIFGGLGVAFILTGLGIIDL